jgi:hypothetical protein
MSNRFFALAVLISVCSGTTFLNPHFEWKTVLSEMNKADAVKSLNPKKYEMHVQKIEHELLSSCVHFGSELSEFYSHWRFGLVGLTAADFKELDRFQKSVKEMTKKGTEKADFYELMEASILYQEGDEVYRPLMQAILEYEVGNTGKSSLIV